MKILYNQTKKLKMIAATGMLLSLPCFIKANELPVKSVAGTTKTIKEQIKFPNSNIFKEQTEKVNVVFTVNETGNINLVIANTTNLLLKKWIEEQFLKLNLKQLVADNAYSTV